MSRRSTSIKFTRTTFALFLSICFMICILSFILGFQLGRTSKSTSDTGKGMTKVVPADPYAGTAAMGATQTSSTEDLSFYQSLQRRTPSLPYDRPTEPVTRPTMRPTQRIEPTPTKMISPRPTATATTQQDAKFTIQVASLTSKVKADALTKTLQDHGFPAYLSESPMPGNQTLYRVRVGKFTTRDAAQFVAQEIKSRERLETWITPLH